MRKIADAISGESYPKHPQRKFNAPRFVEMDEDERDAMRRRVRAQEHADRQETSRLRTEASQHREPPKPAKASKAPKGNFVEDLIHTSTRLSESLEGVAKSLSVAMDGFRSVARQATEVVAEFASTADQLRAALRGEQPRSAPKDAYDTDRTHRL